MTKRIEQSRRHGHYDPRWTDRLHLVTENPVLDEPEVLIEVLPPPPVLTLVGGSSIVADAGTA